MAVTGPKTDGWLVKTVGILVASIGATLMMAGRRRRVTDEVATLALSTAAGLGTVDIVYALRGRIAKIYLFDAVLELALIAAWARLAGMRIAPLGAIEGWTHGDRH